MAGIGKVENLRPWQPGQSGNPGGRPKRKYLTDEYTAHADRPVTAELAKQLGLPEEMIGWTYAQATSEMVWRRAMAGDPAAADKLADRLEGKAMQAVELSGPAGGPVELLRKYEQFTDAQLADLERIARELDAAGVPLALPERTSPVKTREKTRPCAQTLRQGLAVPASQPRTTGGQDPGDRHGSSRTRLRLR